MKINIWEERSKKDITLEKLSELTGISRGALHNYEIELRSPTLLQLEKIAIALNIKISDLFESDYK